MELLSASNFVYNSPESLSMRAPSSLPPMLETAKGPTTELRPNSETALYASSVALLMSSLAPARAEAFEQHKACFRKPVSQYDMICAHVQEPVIIKVRAKKVTIALWRYSRNDDVVTRRSQAADEHYQTCKGTAKFGLKSE